MSTPAFTSQNAERELPLEAAEVWSPYILDTQYPHLPFTNVHGYEEIKKISMA